MLKYAWLLTEPESPHPDRSNRTVAATETGTRAPLRRFMRGSYGAGGKREPFPRQRRNSEQTTRRVVENVVDLAEEPSGRVQQPDRADVGEPGERPAA